MKNCLKFAIALVAIGRASYAADFVNGGFESGTNGWSLISGDWSATTSTTGHGASKVTNTTVTYNTNNNYQSDSTVISDSAAKDTNTLGNLSMVFEGSKSYRLGNEANGAHWAQVSQTVTNYTANSLYFAFAAILENPDSGHTPEETPKFSFSILDQTTSSTLYSVAFNSINASSQGITWKTGLRNSGNSSTWMYSDWNIIQIDTSALTGHTLSIDATAYDCALGGHGGYAYIDAFSQNLPVANIGVSTSGGPITAQTFNSIPEPSTYALFGLGALGLVIAYRRRVA